MDLAGKAEALLAFAPPELLAAVREITSREKGVFEQRLEEQRVAVSAAEQELGTIKAQTDVYAKQLEQEREERSVLAASEARLEAKVEAMNEAVEAKRAENAAISDE